MNVSHCLRVVARHAPNASKTTILLRSSIPRIAPARSPIPSSSRSISLLSAHRPTLSTSPALANLPTSTPTAIPSSDAPDLASKISSHPALGSLQIRCGPRDTYNPSHFVRKRRHGFLSRLRTKKGRKLLMRRIKKGRWNLSH